MLTPEEMKLVTEIDQRSKSNTKRLDEVVKKQDELGELVSSVKVLAIKSEAMDGDIKEIKGDVKTLMEKPGKRWESIVEKALWAVIGAVIVYLLAQIGL